MSAEITEDQYRRLKRAVDDARTEADRARGARDQLLSRLKEEFNCESLEGAKKMLEGLKAKKSKLQTAFEKAMEEYEEKWNHA
jgi:hypothetical protein